MWGGQNSTKNNYKYVKSTNDSKIPNDAKKFIKAIYNSELDRYDNNLNNDYKTILNDNCFYLPNFFENSHDRTLFDKIKNDLVESKCELVTWSRHFKFENPTFLLTFNEIVSKMAKHFNLEVFETRLNYYPDNKSWKPFHRDSHKIYYNEKYKNGIKENFTLGASFGATRELEFKHEKTNNTFKFPQNNGDCFAFTSDVNDVFLHSVPKTSRNVGPRFSIIVWGCN